MSLLFLIVHRLHRIWK